ncbi:MAG: type 11 methyltransferase [Parcubacteria group bacterium]|nr:type 11 methyltransferase [Parcubacteria group bacterium]
MHFADPMKNILQMGLTDGMKVGDLGTGTGHYALAASGIVGPAGQVYAIDIQEDVLTHIRDAARGRKFKNIETVWGDFEKQGGTKLRDHVLDAAVLSNVLFQLEDKEGAIAELRRILKPEGKLLVVDWSGSWDGMGPAQELVVSERDAEALFIRAGFHKVKSFTGGPHHYSILFTSP